MGKTRKSNSSSKSETFNMQSVDNYLMERANSISISESSKCCTKAKFFNFCRKFITFLISRVGLMIVMVGYVLGGGLMFEAVESDYENKALNLSETILKEMLQRIYKQIENNSTRVKDDTFYFFLRDEIRTFGDFFTNATLNGTLTGHIEPKWDFFGSVFYCVTLVAAIGYGHITCKTKLGKILTIIYSSIGIPLMMLFLANTGSSTATVFRFFYLKVNSMKRGLRNRKLNRIKKAAWQNLELSEYPEDENYNNNNNIKETFNLGENTSISKLNSNVEVLKTFKESDNSKQQDEKTTKIEKNLVKNENETHDDSKTKKLKKITYVETSPCVSVSVGIRNVDIPMEFIQTLINTSQTPQTHLTEIQSSSNSKQYYSNNLTKNTNKKSIDSKAIEAVKKLDDLILIERKSFLDQDQILEPESESYFSKDDKMITDSFEDVLDDFKKISSNTLNDDEFNSTDNLNNDYLISNIFKKSSNQARPPKRSSSGIQKQGFKSSSLNESKIRKNNEKLKLSTSQSDVLISQKANLETTTSQNTNGTSSFSPVNLTPPIINSNTNTNSTTTNSNNPAVQSRINETKLNLNLNLKPDPMLNDNSRKLNSSLSTPIFESVSVSNFNTDDSSRNKFKRKTNTTRSVYSYDYHMLQQNRSLRKSSVKFKPTHFPIYNTKQLSLIYKQYKQERQERAGVPMVYTLIILALYLICGMLIFSSYENWKKLDALYFCFVTLTTIGFGDLIPGSTLLNKNGNKNSLYISALYIFIGLIIIAMCINLVKTQLKLKIKSIARKFGLSNS